MSQSINLIGPSFLVEGEDKYVFQDGESIVTRKLLIVIAVAAAAAAAVDTGIVRMRFI